MPSSRPVRAAALVGAACAGLAVGLLGGRDYERWRALGPGGLPSTPRGWLTVTGLRLRARGTVDPGVFGPLLGSPGDDSRLGDLPPRRGLRPTVAPYPIPHRQTDQVGGPHARAAVLDRFDERAHGGAARVGYRTSAFEKHHDAVTALDLTDAPPLSRRAHGEIAHIHPSDGSMHMILGPSDATAVLSAGWGERHPLAGVLGDLPLTYLLVYSPRDLDEARVIGRVLDAAIGYALGK